MGMLSKSQNNRKSLFLSYRNGDGDGQCNEEWSELILKQLQHYNFQELCQLNEEKIKLN